MTVKIYDMQGREIITLKDETMSKGRQVLYWGGEKENKQKSD